MCSTLAKNDGPNHLHGGPGGFHTVPWEVSAIGDGAEPSLALRYVSRDGEEGYPGTVDVEAVYTLTSDRALRVDYTARTDRPTVVNLTQHSYFNLAGHAAGSILGHELRLWASRFLPDRSPRHPVGHRRVRCAGRRSISWSAAPIGARMAAQSTTNSCATATATTTASRSTAGTERCARSPSSSSRCRDAGCWCAPPSRGCSFTSARTWAGSRASAARATTRTPGSAWRRSAFRTRRTTRISVDAPRARRDVPPDDRVRVPRGLTLARDAGGYPEMTEKDAAAKLSLSFSTATVAQHSIADRNGVCSGPVFQKSKGALVGPVLFAALAGIGCGSSGTLRVTKVAVSTQKPGNLALYLDVRDNGRPVPGLQEKDFRVYEDGKLISPKKGKRALLDADVVSANFAIVQVDLSGPIADSEYLPDLARDASRTSPRI